MAEDSDEPKGWVFETEEVSNNVYRVSGIDPHGRRVGRTGTDPDALLAGCKADAIKIVQQVRAGRNRQEQ